MSVFPSSFEKYPINIPIEQEFTYSEYNSKAGDSESCDQNQNTKGLAFSCRYQWEIQTYH